MLDIGWWELLVVGLIALVVVGPKELPALLRTIGRYVGMAKRQADEFRAQFDEALRESEFNELRKEMNDLKSGVSSSLDEANKSINEKLDDDDDDEFEDEYDWDSDGPIKPAAEFANDEPTTSFTMPDGEVVKKREDGEVVDKNDSGAAATEPGQSTAAAAETTAPAEPDAGPGGVTKTAANDPDKSAAADSTAARDAEAVR
jgi:sec-independent protein translocase protein TatB